MTSSVLDTTVVLLQVLASVSVVHAAVTAVLVPICLRLRAWLLPANLLRRYTVRNDQQGDATPVLWAVVTGASQGLGREYAAAMASRGFGVVLIARRQDVLAQVAQQLTEQYHVPTECVVADFSAEDQQALYAEIGERLEQLPAPAVLVNNVGIDPTFPGLFHLQDISELLRVVRVNTRSMRRMTSLVLPRMLDRRANTDAGVTGGIINVGSMSSTISVPTNTTYGASKAWNHWFSLCLAAEYRDRVDVLLVRPGRTATPGRPGRHAGLFTPAAKPVVWQSVRWLALAWQVIPLLPHAAQHSLVQLLPGWVSATLARRGVERESRARRAAWLPESTAQVPSTRVAGTLATDQQA